MTYEEYIAQMTRIQQAMHTLKLVKKENCRALYERRRMSHEDLKAQFKKDLDKIEEDYRTKIDIENKEYLDRIGRLFLEMSNLKSHWLKEQGITPPLRRSRRYSGKTVITHAAPAAT